jgi:peptidoglycan/LPS O-acetylase OafA/YrhL
MTLTLTRQPETTVADLVETVPAPNSQEAVYRHDLDGLRGVAIALVAIFHVWFGRVSGGVDVFLALSGFFFGGSVLRNALTPGTSLSPQANIRRLVRRLIPALVLVLAVSAVLTVLIQPQTRWETFADQSLASLGYYQNWELATTASNYLRAGEAVSPLQHIWSMSVQGQFYISFLLLVFGLTALLRTKVGGNRLRTVFVVLFAILTIASFVFAIVAHRSDPVTAYYNSFARAWELLLGVLIGALVPHVTWPMWLRTALATVGLAAILFCGAFIDGVKQFPGPWALVPVGATMLLILAGANRGARLSTRQRLPGPNRLLATRPLRTLGSMAYSLYLWHWPLLIFWLAYRGGTRPGFLDGLVILLVSGVLAYLTTRFVEEPLRYAGRSKVIRAGSDVRRRRPSPTMVGGIAITLLAVALTATSLSWREHVTAQRAGGRELADLPADSYPGARALLNDAKVPQLPFRPTVLEARGDVPESTNDGCISDFANAGIINCTYGDPTATRTIALAGGSHAEHWITALDALGKEHGFKVVTYLKMGCPLTTEPNPLVMGDNRPYPQCRQWNELVLPRLIADRPDFVFTTSTRPWHIKPGDMMPGTYLGIWQKLSDAGIPILAMRDTPWLVADGNDPFIPADCLAKGGDAVSCGIDRFAVLSEHNQTLDFVERFPLLKPLDMSEAVCRTDFCRAIEGNVLIYHDSHHISATYMRTMTPELGRQLGAATGWW